MIGPTRLKTKKKFPGKAEAKSLKSASWYLHFLSLLISCFMFPRRKMSSEQVFQSTAVVDCSCFLIIPFGKFCPGTKKKTKTKRKQNTNCVNEPHPVLTAKPLKSNNCTWILLNKQSHIDLIILHFRSKHEAYLALGWIEPRSVIITKAPDAREYRYQSVRCEALGQWTRWEAHPSKTGSGFFCCCFPGLTGLICEVKAAI